MDILIPHLHLPLIPSGEARILWHQDYYDGPLSGLCLWQGAKYWFVCCAEGKAVYREDDSIVKELSDNFHRRFILIPLSEDDLREAEFWHELFREKVSPNTDYDDDGWRLMLPQRPQGLHHEYYDAQKSRVRRPVRPEDAVAFFERGSPGWTGPNPAKDD